MFFDDCDGVTFARLRFDYIARVLIGSVLIMTAVLKGVSYFTEPNWNADVSIRDPAIAAVELILAAWLLSGIAPRASWAFSLLLFSIFAGVALTRALTGQESCGCFGAIEVNPWWTAAFDCAVIALLLACRQDVWATPASGDRARRGHFALAALAVVVFTAYMTWSMRPYSAFADSLRGDSGSIARLNPHDWIGKEFPLAPFTDLGKQLENGLWRVALVRHDCPKCRALVQNFAHSEFTHERLAVIQIPPYGTIPAISSGPIVQGRLASTREWLVKTPVEIVLESGRVISVLYD